MSMCGGRRAFARRRRYLATPELHRGRRTIAPCTALPGARRGRLTCSLWRLHQISRGGGVLVLIGDKCIEGLQAVLLAHKRVHRSMS